MGYRGTIKRTGIFPVLVLLVPTKVNFLSSSNRWADSVCSQTLKYRLSFITQSQVVCVSYLTIGFLLISYSKACVKTQ